MKNRDDSGPQITPTPVETPSKLGRMPSTRALTKVQIARVRARLQELYKQTGSQTVAAREIGISQQVLNRILKGDAAGLYVAKKLAVFDHVPLEVILDGAPEELLTVLRVRPGKWSDPAIAAVCKYASVTKLAESTEHWANLLDQVDRALAHIVHNGRTKK